MSIARSVLFIKLDDKTQQAIYRHDIENESFYGIFGVAEDHAPMDLKESEWEQIDENAWSKETKRWKLNLVIFGDIKNEQS